MAFAMNAGMQRDEKGHEMDRICANVQGLHWSE